MKITFQCKSLNISDMKSTFCSKYRKCDRYTNSIAGRTF